MDIVDIFGINFSHSINVLYVYLWIIFFYSQLQDILDMCEIRPVNNQVEVNPYFQNDKLVEFCQMNNIIVSAFGPVRNSKY